MLRRNKHGRFMKGGKRKHRARRRSNPHRRHRRRAHHVRRRRSNPHMLLANPSSPGQLGLFDQFGQKIKAVANIRSLTKKKARKRKGPKRAASRGVTHTRAVVRRAKGKRKYYRIYRGRGRSPKYRIFRRSNPFGAWGALIRLGVAGGLGIVTARTGGRLYTDKLSKFVLGASGASDPKSLRAILNEGLRIVAMGALPILTERYVLRHVPMVTGADRMAFQLGGLAEAGRQGIGVVLTKIKPGMDKARYGLDGPLPYVQYHQDDAGMIYGLHPSGQWYAIGRRNGMSGLMSADRFGGMAGAMSADEFGGMDGVDDDDDNDSIAG